MERCDRGLLSRLDCEKAADGKLREEVGDITSAVDELASEREGAFEDAADWVQSEVDRPFGLTDGWRAGGESRWKRGVTTHIVKCIN